MAGQARQRAQARLADLLEQQAQATARLAALTGRSSATREHAQQDIGDARDRGAASADLRTERERIDRELSALETRRVAEVERERRRCSAPEVRCNLSAIEGAYRRQRDDLARRQRELLAEQSDVRDRADQIAAAARQRRDADLDGKDRERASLQQTIEDSLRQQIASAQTAGSRAAPPLSGPPARATN